MREKARDKRRIEDIIAYSEKFLQILQHKVKPVKAGNNYRYCLVYKNREVDGAYTKQGFLEVLKEL